MKKIVVICFCVLLTIFLPGCKENQKIIADYITVYDTDVLLGDNVDNVMSSFGKPDYTHKAVSCHYGGHDTIYYYNGLTIYTYLENTVNVIYCIEITGETIATPEGAAVGMDKAEIVSIYGSSYTELPNGISYDICQDKSSINFRIQNGQVSCIEYYLE